MDHVGLLGSAWVYSLDSANPLVGGSLLTSAGAPNSTASTSSLNVTQNQVQSRPETVPQAEGSSACLQQGGCAASTVVTPLGSGNPTATPLGSVLVVGLTFSAVIVLGALLVARRRPPRSPSRTPSEYAPHPSSEPRSSPPAATEGGEADPLHDLW
jgi:hypothetical protein